MNFEKKHQQLLPARKFIHRQLIFLVISSALIFFSILIGSIGYYYFADLSILNAFYNACMILTGMGPIDKITTPSGKIFASLYALYSGIAFLSICAVLLAPITHRLLHIMHIEEEKSKTDESIY